MFAGGMKSVKLRSGDDTLMGDCLPGVAETDFALVWVHGFGSHRGGEKAEAVRRECAAAGGPSPPLTFADMANRPAQFIPFASTLIEDSRRQSASFWPRAVSRVWGWSVRAWERLPQPGSRYQYPESVVGCVLLAPAFKFLERRRGSG